MNNVKCRKCRFCLPIDANLLNVSEDFVCCSSLQQILPIEIVEESSDALPEWVKKCLDEGEWCKGKILCPKCQSKVGGFDFISGTKCCCRQRRLLPEIHLNKCKIDMVETQQSHDQPRRSQLIDNIRNENWPILSEDAKTMPTFVKTHRKTNSWHSASATSISGTLNNIFGTFLLRRSKSTPKFLEQRRTLTEIVETDRQLDNKIEFDRHPCNKTPKKSSEAKIEMHRNSKLPNVAVSVPDYLICCICLEIFCLPRSCLPCSHTFCEPCLRLLTDAQRKSTSTLSHLKVLCPLCRRLIQFTEPDQETLQTVRSCFPNEYQLRLNWYKRQSALRRHPLPGFQSWSYVHGLFRRLPYGLSRRITSQFSPLWTLYSFCLSFLCVVFFFVCFVPAVYVSTYIYNYVEKLQIFCPSDDGADNFRSWYEYLSFELGTFVVFIVNGGAVSATVSIMITTSVAIYLVFLM